MNINGLSGFSAAYHRLSVPVVFELAKRTALLVSVLCLSIIIRNSLKRWWNGPDNGALIGRHITDLKKLVSKRERPDLKFRSDLLTSCIKSLNSGMNLIVVGDKGCGKTTFLEQLPFLYIQLSIRDIFPKRILSLDLLSLSSDLDPIKYIGSLIGSLKPNDVLVIDDIHHGDNIDVFEMLKKACEKKKIRVIATTSTFGWNQKIRNSPISSVFTRVEIPPLSLEQSSELITAHMKHLEIVHQRTYEPGMDLLISRVIRQFKISIGKIKDSLHSSIAQAKEKTVSQESFRAILAQQLDLPAHALGGMNMKLFSEIKSSLESNIVGQRAALCATCDALQVYFAGIQERDKPIGGGGFLLVGPTGTGKTSVAQMLANLMFNGAITHINMANYKEEHSLSGLIGSPPGYLGYSSVGGGLLTSAVSERPFQVVLLDELEKAHPKVLNLMLQIMAEGWTTNGAGRTVNFRSTMVVMTSNLGSDIRDPLGNGVISQEEMEANITRSVNNFFSPEFLARLRVITFYPLTAEELRTVFDLELSKFNRMIQDRGIHFEITTPVKDCIFQSGPIDGSRGLKKLITDLLMVPLSEQIMKNPSCQSFKADVIEGTIAILPVLI